MSGRFGVERQVAIVTGASSGIGRAIAERFAEGGASVVVCSREQDNVDPVAEKIEESGGNALAVKCDVTDRGAVEALVEATVEEFGGIDCLVNNAGASFMAGFDDISENGWQTIVDINLHGTYHCTQAAGEHLKDGGGTVINLASVAGQRGSPYMSHYGAAKAGIINLTTTLSAEWAGEGVRVNCIAPGFVATPGVESQMGVSAENIDRGDVERRIGLSEEIADIAQFLASPASSYVVGETITAGGVPRVEESPEV
ncbi:3-phenylpropionate-dihydrodiol/cinnamic acid-dihydrodiol dehydrogenase [Halalkalicoccus paucihalophilus]|uniref:3-phenylpropionate-dihydrodiol/cinnamic acid-dihydrodiol dehydrogenase n=1 Tax=Halalkalicoccus paucihalophilus TaxID=1008153 RepID=A0A151AIP4_9EURY|nr:SDR family NAD(P)-dependent oxidoreductase [Halalkalicoccus paucihalophilus]KYH27380.1 3-phenylpropionate-dihydrodiol/cinnamic acid-dihydrodiol dehydrogenase [Halalkalicoccus paucihalophilus]